MYYCVRNTRRSAQPSLSCIIVDGEGAYLTAPWRNAWCSNSCQLHQQIKRMVVRPRYRPTTQQHGCVKRHTRLLLAFAASFPRHPRHLGAVVNHVGHVGHLRLMAIEETEQVCELLIVCT